MAHAPCADKARKVQGVSCPVHNRQQRHAEALRVTVLCLRSSALVSCQQDRGFSKKGRHHIQKTLFWTPDMTLSVQKWSATLLGSPNNVDRTDRRIVGTLHTVTETPLDEWSANYRFLYLNNKQHKVNSPFTDLDRIVGQHGVEDSRISRQSAHEGDKVVSPTHRPPLPLGNIPDTHFC